MRVTNKSKDMLELSNFFIVEVLLGNNHSFDDKYFMWFITRGLRVLQATVQNTQYYVSYIVESMALQ